MDKARMREIDRFLNCKKYAVAGVSRTDHKFGNSIFREMKKKGYNVVPVNPHLESLDGETCYRSISELPGDVDALIISTKPDVSMKLVMEAEEKGIRNIFLQQGSKNQEIAKITSSGNGLNLISGHCILMFIDPTGIHRFHAAIWKLFGLYPK